MPNPQIPAAHAHVSAAVAPRRPRSVHALVCAGALQSCPTACAWRSHAPSLGCLFEHCQLGSASIKFLVAGRLACPARGSKGASSLGLLLPSAFLPYLLCIFLPCLPRLSLPQPPQHRADNVCRRLERRLVSKVQVQLSRIIAQRAELGGEQARGHEVAARCGAPRQPGFKRGRGGLEQHLQWAAKREKKRVSQLSATYARCIKAAIGVKGKRVGRWLGAEQRTGARQPFEGLSLSQRRQHQAALPAMAGAQQAGECSINDLMLKAAY